MYEQGLQRAIVRLACLGVVGVVGCSSGDDGSMGSGFDDAAPVPASTAWPEPAPPAGSMIPPEAPAPNTAPPQTDMTGVIDSPVDDGFAGAPAPAPFEQPVDSGDDHLTHYPASHKCFQRRGHLTEYRSPLHCPVHAIPVRNYRSVRIFHGTNRLSQISQRNTEIIVKIPVS